VAAPPPPMKMNFHFRASRLLAVWFGRADNDEQNNDSSRHCRSHFISAQAGFDESGELPEGSASSGVSGAQHPNLFPLLPAVSLIDGERESGLANLMPALMIGVEMNWKQSERD
jgi:hypothetical protein